MTTRFTTATTVGELAEWWLETIARHQVKVSTLDSYRKFSDDARRLITAAEGLRWGAELTLLFCQGWRVSEVLGLAWEDIDLDAATAQVRRGALYTPSVGVVLGTTKTSGAEGVHHLAPTSVTHLRSRLAEQQAERAEDWPIHTYGGSVIHPVFTKSDGQLVTRQAITKIVERAAVRAWHCRRTRCSRPARR